MKVRAKSFTILSLLIILGLSSCGESKVSQCNKTIAVINKGENLGKKLEQETANLDKPGNAGNLQQIADTSAKVSSVYKGGIVDIAKIRTELQGLQLKDEKLKDFQTRYVTLLQGSEKTLQSVSGVLDKLGKAKNAQDVAKIQPNLQNLAKIQADANQIEKDENALISELNTYCGAKK